MPFLPVISMKFQLQNQITKSLQVPCIPPENIYQNPLWPGKRVLPSASVQGKRVSASITAEAALCLPLFLFFAAALMEPMRWLDRQRQVQTEVECFCEGLSQYAYLREVNSGKRQEKGTEKGEETEKEAEYIGLLSDAASGLWLRGRLKKYADGVTVKRAEIPESTGDIVFEVEYREKIPFFPVGTGGVTMHAAARRRSFTGLDGKVKEPQTAVPGPDSEGEIMVYVGAGMGRYHLYRDCHYISNQYEAVSFDQAAVMKNGSGKSYTPCSRCASGGGSDEEVYITREGEHYHFSEACTAMVSYVRSVPLKEVEYLGVCSWCAGREQEE